MGIISDLVDSGLFTTSKNPWTKGKLAAWAREYKFDVTQDVIIKRTPPWAKARGHLSAMTPAQLEAIRALVTLVQSLAGTGKVIPAEVRASLDKKTYGGKSASERREEKRKRTKYILAQIDKLLEEKGRPVKAAAPATAGGAAAPPA